VQHPEIVAAYIKANWRYDPETGVITGTKGRPIGVRMRGYLIGTVHVGAGTITVSFGRVAWLMMTGKWPERQIDHRDGVRSNNRWVNLREASARENAQNRKPRPRKHEGLPVGVYLTRDGRYMAQRRHRGALIYGGTFSTVDEAGAKSAEMKATLHPFQPTQRQ
jgi:hypothetical protein